VLKTIYLPSVQLGYDVELTHHGKCNALKSLAIEECENVSIITHEINNSRQSSSQ
jgi:hypothetical protein